MNFRFSFLAFVILYGCISFGQQTTNGDGTQKAATNTVVVEAEAKSPSEIAIPPATSEKYNVTPPVGNPVDIGSWLAKVEMQNGLEGQTKPWHLIVSYDQFDEDGDNVHSGVLDELWVGPKRYRRSYKSDGFNQTDYANEKGLFRVGDQAWPKQVEVQVRSAIVDPFSYARAWNSPHVAEHTRDFGAWKLGCVQFQGSTAVSDPVQFCFDESGSELRYVRGEGWHQTTYNDLTEFEGRHVARSVTITDGGKPYLNIRIGSLEELKSVADDAFSPPADAVALSGKRAVGIMMRPSTMVPPKFPSSFRGRKFKVQVDIVVGKDGHVISAHATSGPEDAAKICEDAIRQWIYAPYEILGEPVEVQTQSGCSMF